MEIWKKMWVGVFFSEHSVDWQYSLTFVACVLPTQPDSVQYVICNY